MNWWQIVEHWLQIGVYGHCPLCQRPAEQIFCQDCLHQLRGCQCPDPKVTGPESLPVLAWGIYTGPLKRAISYLKYDRNPQIAQPLGEWLAQVWLQSHPSDDPCVVVPIPLHRDRQAQRGYNQATLIARRFCQVTGLSLRAQGLVRHRNTTAQFGLSQAQRQQNVDRAFGLGPDFERRHPQRPVLLLDDIYTTGATAHSAARALWAADIRVQGVIAVAQAQRFTSASPA